MTGRSDAAKMAAGLAAIKHLEAQRAAEARDVADRANARPAPPSIADRPGRAARRLAESVRCPFCHAQPGQPCRTQGRAQRQMPASHPSRLDAGRLAADLSAAAAAIETHQTISEGSS